MSAAVAAFIYRFRFVLSGLIILGAVALAPSVNFTRIDNEISMWISEDDPVYQTYERFRKEFGGQRTLLIALRSDRLFTPRNLAFIRDITECTDAHKIHIVDNQI